ncbi:MAG: hypothetical protein ACLUD2_07595 [Clostridium sp.]
MQGGIPDCPLCGRKRRDHGVEVQPILIHAEHNGNGQTADPDGALAGR